MLVPLPLPPSALPSLRNILPSPEGSCQGVFDRSSHPILPAYIQQVIAFIIGDACAGLGVWSWRDT